MLGSSLQEMGGKKKRGAKQAPASEQQEACSVTALPQGQSSAVPAQPSASADWDAVAESILRALASADVGSDAVGAVCARLSGANAGEGGEDEEAWRAVAAAFLARGGLDQLGVTLKRCAEAPSERTERSAVAALLVLGELCLFQTPGSVDAIIRLLRSAALGLGAFPSSVEVVTAAYGAFVVGCNAASDNWPTWTFPPFIVDASLQAVALLHRSGCPAWVLARGTAAVYAAARICQAAHWRSGETPIPEDILEPFLSVLAAESEPVAVPPGRTTQIYLALDALAWLSRIEPALGVHAAEQGVAAAARGALAASRCAAADLQVLRGSAMRCMLSLVAADIDRAAGQVLAGGAAEAAAAVLSSRPDAEAAQAACRVLGALSWCSRQRVLDDFIARAERCGLAALIDRALLERGKDVAYPIALVRDLLQLPPLTPSTSTATPVLFIYGPGGFVLKPAPGAPRGGVMPTVFFRAQGEFAAEFLTAEQGFKDTRLEKASAAAANPLEGLGIDMSGDVVSEFPGWAMPKGAAMMQMFKVRLGTGHRAPLTLHVSMRWPPTVLLLTHLRRKRPRHRNAGLPQ